jgi:hypothetical protein
MTKTNFTSVLISLPIQVAADLDLALFDPVRGKIKYGSRSRLISGLVQRWLGKQKDAAAEDEIYSMSPETLAEFEQWRQEKRKKAND